jgi:hypothetical protein
MSGNTPRPGDVMGRVVIRQHGFIRVLQSYARRAHQRTRSTVPAASSKCTAPGCGPVAKVSTAQTIRQTIAIRSVGDIRCPRLQSVDGVGAGFYFKPEWAVAGSHIIEPTGPMMGPNAVADVMPLGGRQMLG